MEMFTKEELAKIAEWTLEDFQNDPLGAMKKVREMAASQMDLQRERDAAVHDLEKLMPVSYFDDRCEFCKKDEGYKCPLLRGGACRPEWRGPREEAS